jgi:glycosyltransferase involved in cell wall biosynthesis
VRVLIAHNRYRANGGEERHVELLDRGLREAGVEVRRFERDSRDLEGSAGRRAVAGLALAYRPGAGGIRGPLRELRPDVVHFHNIWPLLTPSALRASKRNGAAVVLTVHNYRFACAGGTLWHDGRVHDDCIDGSSLRCGIRNPRSNLAESIAYGAALELQRRTRMLRRWVDAFIAPSDFVAGMLVRAGIPARRVHTIPYGIPLHREPSPQRRRFALFAGRLVPEKGIETLLTAAGLCPDVPVALAGDGPLAPSVRRAGANVIHLGPLGRSRLSEALADAAFTLVPSEWYDNLPFAALESLGAGRAVIATKIGGLPEIVEDGVTGLLVRPGSPSALAAALRALWGDGERTAVMGSRALVSAERRFSLQTQTRAIVDLYARLARDAI